MLPLLLVCASVTDWGPQWYTGGTPRSTALKTVGPPVVRNFHRAGSIQDMVACDKSLPWSSDGVQIDARCVHMQVVKSNMTTPVAPSVDFLRGSHFAAFVGNEGFKTFGSTATFTQDDTQLYYPVAADEDGNHVMVVRAPDTVPPDCATTRCQNTHLKQLSLLLDWAATHTFVNETHDADGPPDTTTPMFFVSGNKPVHRRNPTWGVLSEVVILGMVVAVAAASTSRKPRRDIDLDSKSPSSIGMPQESDKTDAGPIKEIDHELYACAVVAIVSAVATTITAAVYSKEMSRDDGSVVRSIDGTDVAVSPPKLQLIMATAVSWACAGFLITGIGDMFRGKDIRNSAIHRALIAFAAAVAVAYAIVFPTSVEGVHGTRATHNPSKDDAEQSMATTEQLISGAYESPDDADSALHKGVSTIHRASVIFGILAVGGAYICCYVAHRRDVDLHASWSTLYIAGAGAFGAVAAFNQLYADYHDLKTIFICADAKNLQRDTNVYLTCAAVAYLLGTLLCLIAICRKRVVSATMMNQAGVSLVALGAVLHLTPTYVQSSTPCAVLESVYMGPLVSALAVSVVVSALIVHGISPCKPIPFKYFKKKGQDLPPYSQLDESGI